MSASPKVSVVIPCFNHGEFLPEAVASVLSANRSDIELIVVDDGSTDELTRAEMNKLESSGVRVIRQENKGLSAARNTGIRASTAEYIFPLDDDDRARPASIDRAIRILDTDPKTGIVYGDTELFGASDGRWVASSFELRRLLDRNFITCSALFRRPVWEQNGGYDERMKQGFEDWEFWLNAYEHGWHFSYIPEALFEYRQRENSMLTEARKVESSVAEYVAAKHVALYRRDWAQLAFEHDSGTATFRNLRRIVAKRLKHKFGLNGNHAK